jgi:hypothetical protein
MVGEHHHGRTTPSLAVEFTNLPRGEAYDIHAAVKDMFPVKPAPSGLRLMIPRSKTDAAGEGAQIAIMRGAQEDTCPVRAPRAWLRAAEIGDGPVFRRVISNASPSGKLDL